jgi:hypothetical protein
LGGFSLYLLTFGSPGTSDAGNEHPASIASAIPPINTRMRLPYFRKKSSEKRLLEIVVAARTAIDANVCSAADTQTTVPGIVPFVQVRHPSFMGFMLPLGDPLPLRPAQLMGVDQLHHLACRRIEIHDQLMGPGPEIVSRTHF